MVARRPPLTDAALELLNVETKHTHGPDHPSRFATARHKLYLAYLEEAGGDNDRVEELLFERVKIPMNTVRRFFYSVWKDDVYFPSEIRELFHNAAPVIHAALVARSTPIARPMILHKLEEAYSAKFRSRKTFEIIEIFNAAIPDLAGQFSVDLKALTLVPLPA